MAKEEPVFLNFFCEFEQAGESPYLDKKKA
jgi:hypothetical protein